MEETGDTVGNVAREPRNIVVTEQCGYGAGADGNGGRWEDVARTVVVSYEPFESWMDSVDPEVPHRTEIVFIGLGECVRSTAAASSPPAETEPQLAGSPTVVTIPDATDLAELGITIRSHLESPTISQQDTRHVALCFDSVNELVASVTLPKAFRFLHILTASVKQQEVYAHYHVDPDELGTEAYGTLMTLFDTPGSP